MAVDALYYRNANLGAVLFGFTGRERTDTAGIRLRRTAHGVEGSLGVIIQGGDAAGRAVRAFAVHADISRSFDAAARSPRITARLDILSGGDLTGRHIATFNALYPNVAYSTEATIEAPANLVQLGPVAPIAPTSGVTVQYTLEGLWRYSSRDASYAAPLFPLIAPGSDRDRFSGIEQQLRAVWQAGRVVAVTAAVVHFAGGEALRRAVPATRPSP